MNFGLLWETKINNKQWIWLAIDRDTREIVGLYVGDRSRQSAQALWDSLPAVYRQCAVSDTDFWEAYETVFPFPSPSPGWEGNWTNKSCGTVKLYINATNFSFSHKNLVFF